LRFFQIQSFFKKKSIEDVNQLNQRIDSVEVAEFDDFGESFNYRLQAI
jgi:hypothetical protein